MGEPIVVAVHDHRSALGDVAVLVDVARHRGHARQSEVEGLDVAPEVLEERQHEATDARVDVTANAGVVGQRGEFLDGVHDAVGVVERRRDHHRRAIAQGVSHRRHVAAPFRVEGHRHEVEVEVVGRFRVGRVGRGRGDDLWSSDPARAGTLAVHEHRQQN